MLDPSEAYHDHSLDERVPEREYFEGEGVSSYDVLMISKEGGNPRGLSIVDIDSLKRRERRQKRSLGEDGLPQLLEPKKD